MDQQKTNSARIISLIASATEIVCALGMREFLVGRSHECDYPADIGPLPVCTGPKFNVDGTSYEIDQRVRAVLQEALSVYRVDADILDSLAPTLIITQSQCEVCAVSLCDVQEAACKLVHSQPEIVSLQPNSLEDVWLDIMKVGTALKIEKKAQGLVQDLKQRLASIARKAQSISPQPKVIFIEWIDPLMVGGNWMPTLINLAGGIDLLGEADRHSPAVPWEKLKQADPDIIIVSPCGFAIERTLQDMHFLYDLPGWQQLKAAVNKKVYVADGNQYFNRPGPRLIESLEILAEIFHPQVFKFRHQGTGWIAVDTDNRA